MKNLGFKDVYRMNVKGWKKYVCLGKSDQNRSRMAILPLDKIDFKKKKVTRDNKGHFIMLKSQ